MRLDIYRDIFDPDMLHIVQDEDIVWSIVLSEYEGDMLALGEQLEKGEGLDELDMDYLEHVEGVMETKQIAMYQDEQVTLFVFVDVLTNAERTFLGWNEK